MDDELGLYYVMRVFGAQAKEGRCLVNSGSEQF